MYNVGGVKYSSSKIDYSGRSSVQREEDDHRWEIESKADLFRGLGWLSSDSFLPLIR